MIRIIHRVVHISRGVTLAPGRARLAVARSDVNPELLKYSDVIPGYDSSNGGGGPKLRIVENLGPSDRHKPFFCSLFTEGHLPNLPMSDFRIGIRASRVEQPNSIPAMIMRICSFETSSIVSFLLPIQPPEHARGCHEALEDYGGLVCP